MSSTRSGVGGLLLILLLVAIVPVAVVVAFGVPVPFMVAVGIGYMLQLLVIVVAAFHWRNGAKGTRGSRLPSSTESCRRPPWYLWA